MQKGVTDFGLGFVRYRILCEGVAGFVDDGGEEVLFQTKILVNPQSEPGRV